MARGAGARRQRRGAADGVKGSKGIRWRPRRVEAKKDVVNCDKPWGVVNRPRARDVRIGQPVVRHGATSETETSRCQRRTRGIEPS